MSTIQRIDCQRRLITLNVRNAKEFLLGKGTKMRVQSWRMLEERDGRFSDYRFKTRTEPFPETIELVNRYSCAELALEEAPGQH